MSDTDLMSLQEMARELTVLRIQRASCCEPYDCMHHEMCGEEYGSCSGCDRRDFLFSEFYAACEAEGADPANLLRIEEQSIEQERIDFYSRMNELGNEDAAFWTDQE